MPVNERPSSTIGLLPAVPKTAPVFAYPRPSKKETARTIILRPCRAAASPF